VEHRATEGATEGAVGMIDVRVRSIALIRTLLGTEEMPLSLPEGATVEALLARLAESGDPKLASYFAVPKDKSAHAPLRIMVNGRDVSVLAGRETILEDGDDILIFIPIAGG
jgi:molybdopterin synthase sulfur carrier subunit